MRAVTAFLRRHRIVVDTLPSRPTPPSAPPYDSPAPASPSNGAADTAGSSSSSSSSSVSLMSWPIVRDGFRIYVDGWRRFRPRSDGGGSNLNDSPDPAAAGNFADNVKFLRRAGAGQPLKTRAAENAAEMKRFMASPDADLLRSAAAHRIGLVQLTVSQFLQGFYEARDMELKRGAAAAAAAAAAARSAEHTADAHAHPKADVKP